MLCLKKAIADALEVTVGRSSDPVSACEVPYESQILHQGDQFLMYGCHVARAGSGLGSHNEKHAVNGGAR